MQLSMKILSGRKGVEPLEKNCIVFHKDSFPDHVDEEENWDRLTLVHVANDR